MTHIEGGHHLPPTPVYSNAVQASAIRTLSNAKDCTYKYLKKKETQSPQQCRLSLPTPKSASSNFVQAIGELMGIMNKEFGADSEAMLNLEKGNQEQTTSLFLQNKVLKADGVKLKKAIKEKQKLEAKENESTGDKVKDFFKSPMTIIMIVTIVLTIATCGATAALSAEMIAEDVAVEGVEIGEEAGSEGAGAAGESVETASSNAEVEIQSDASTAESDAQTAQNGAKAAESGAKTYADQFPRLAKMVSYMKKLVIPLNLVSAPTYIDTFVKGVYWLNITANPSLNPDNQTKPSSGPGTKTPPPPTSPGQLSTQQHVWVLMASLETGGAES